MSQLAAYIQGLSDATDYNAYNPDTYSCIDDDEIQGYKDGYGDGMDLNMSHENGVCSGATD